MRFLREVMNLSILKKLQNWLLIQRLRRRWDEDNKLRRSARGKGWHGIVEVFHCERSYREIKQEIARKQSQ